MTRRTNRTTPAPTDTPPSHPGAPVHETDLTDSTSKSGKPNGLRLLAEADLLLNQGLRRIAGAGQDLPDACNPIEEALALSETQTMSTLEALDTAQAAIRSIQKTQQGFIDEDIGTIKTAMATILNSQQGQDLAGQRLKKALRLLQAVNERISLALVSLQENLGIPNRDILPNEQTEDTGSLHEDTIVGRTDATALEEAIRGQHIEQDDVDALLAELGI